VFGESVRPSLRAVLANSGVSAVATAVLLFWSLDEGWRALSVPFLNLVNYLVMTVAILDIPYFSYTVADRIALYSALAYALNSAVCLAAAWLLSRWAHGAGPLASLRAYCAITPRRTGA